MPGFTPEDFWTYIRGWAALLYFLLPEPSKETVTNVAIFIYSITQTLPYMAFASYFIDMNLLAISMSLTISLEVVLLFPRGYFFLKRAVPFIG